MKIDIQDYDYPLEDLFIAKFPVSPRDESKLLVYKNSQVEHSVFKDITNFLPSNTHLVLNNTKVIPARLFFQRKTGAHIEIFLLNPIKPSTVLPLVMEENSSTTWHCVIGNKRRWKESETLAGEFLIENKKFKLEAKLIDAAQNLIEFNWQSEIPFSLVVSSYGNVPLPPYLNRKNEVSDKENYQTIYSKNDGAVAAPTAGLHFTDKVFNDLEAKGIKKSFTTLHVGAGTFMPVKEANALNHPMHSEQIVIDKEFLNDLIQNHDFIIPVGTTSMRTLESLYWMGVKLLEGKENPLFIEKLFPYQNHENFSLEQSFSAIVEFLDHENHSQGIAQTEIMIFPSYEFKVCKGLITNFHQPKSTLLLLVAALIGEKKWKDIYLGAKDKNYRFLSFGDSSLLIP